MEITEQQAKEFINTLIESKKHLESKLWEKEELFKIKKVDLQDEIYDLLSELDVKIAEIKALKNELRDLAVSSNTKNGKIADLEVKLKDLTSKLDSLKDKYYYLQEGDLIQEGDEAELINGWEILNDPCIGERYKKGKYAPHRRKISELLKN